MNAPLGWPRGTAEAQTGWASQLCTAPPQLHSRPVTEFKEASAWLNALLLLSFNS